MNGHDKIKSIQILLVEDNPGDIRLTQEAFKEGRILVNLTVATDGVQAIEMLNRHCQLERRRNACRISAKR